MALHDPYELGFPVERSYIGLQGEASYHYPGGVCHDCRLNFGSRNGLIKHAKKYHRGVDFYEASDWAK